MRNCKIVLASSSSYRKKQLNTLMLPFDCHSPNIDESARPDESPTELVKRLSFSKAKAVSTFYSNSLIIGSDQVAADNSGNIITKPGTKENAIKQLQLFSGSTAIFYSGICLLNTNTGKHHIEVVETQVKFRNLTDDQISQYVDKDMPLDCAGSFKCESLGISLFESIDSHDPNALIGLPLIALTNMLQREGIDPLTA